MSEITPADLNLLKYAKENGIIDIDDVREEMIKKERKDLLNRHPFEIYKSGGRYCSYIPDSTKKNNRRLIARRHRKDVEDCIIEYQKSISTSEKLKNSTLESLYPDWLEFKRMHTKAETYIIRIDSDWNTYYVDTEIITTPIKELTKLDLDEWVHTLIQDHNMTKTQYYNSTVIMRQALEYAVDKKIISESPLAKVKVDGKRLFRKVKKKPSNTQVFTRQEQAQLTELAWQDFNNRDRKEQLAPLAVLFQFETGIRAGETGSARYDDIERPNYIHIQRMWRRDTNELVDHAKTDDGDREIYLTSKAKMIIDMARQRQQELGIDDTGYIFSVDGEPLTHKPVAHLYVKYCNKIGTVVKRPHKARKTYITTLIDSGVSINTIRELSGHADERTTYGNYAYDRNTYSEIEAQLEDALNV